MSALPLFLQIMSGAALALAFCGLYVVLRDTRYASVDAGAFMAYTNMLEKGIFFNKHYVYDYQNGPVDQRVCSTGNGVTIHECFHPRIPATFYNLTINLYAMFPAANRFRWAQAANMCLLFLLCLAMFTALQNTVGATAQAGVSPALVAGFGVSLLLARTKLLLTTACIYSEILCFALFGVASILAGQIAQATSPWLALAFGAVFGLVFRNRQCDVVLFATGCLYLLLTAPWWHVLPCAVGFCAMIPDFFYLQFRHKMPAFHYIAVVLSAHLAWTPKSNSRKGNGHEAIMAPQTAKTRRFRLPGFFKTMYNPFARDNYFTSHGISLPLLPLSLYMAVSTGQAGGLFLFLFLSYVAYFCALLVMRSEDTGETFFGSRKAYYMFLTAWGMNICGFAAAIGSGATFVVALYCLAWTGHLVHQLYRVLDLHFHYSLSEDRLHDHRKDPEPYRQVVRDFLRSVPRPAVVMGVHLVMGIPLNFFAWDKGLRLVEMRVCVDEKRLQDLIKGYGVTHIILTPHNFPIDRECSLLKSQLSTELAQLLRPVRLSDEVTVFEVIDNVQEAA